ncbi:hypothetical protein [Legionella oakridgensis]|uniref:Uncharacterized protein n=3 Tax=Legionella oakridgensis TaxID=29423 RepID=W0BIP8_9GAMM|nr:hypothetical protein [Legionella oakridgensis]AHE68269.1 hypothetical protein Loa_02739 [Legionella oakridgensis ATCC 33761 = DSM 21215]KTD39539.1 hypothetical protein Loak_0965 [Legionella oakridgensis]STY21225.1 Uncharacterised protein [Legionella longbeachae]
MPAILVEMDECCFQLIKDGDETLKTSGVSTCLCLMFYGQDQTAPFIGMHHWPGFSSDFDGSEDSAMDDIFELIADIEQNARKQLGNKPDRTLTLNKLIIVGGERRQVDDTGKLLISGTEQEVRALIEFVKPACEEYFMLSSTFTCSIHPFKTTGSQFIDIMMDKDNVAWKIITDDDEQERKLAQEKASCSSPPKLRF